MRLSCEIGQALFPHPQWRRLSDLWASCYPLAGLAPSRRSLFAELEAAMPGFVGLLVNHRPAALRGRSLSEALEVDARSPARLATLFLQWRRAPERMYRAAPSLVFAVVGQARADGRLSPEEENHLLAKLLTHWALRNALVPAADDRRRIRFDDSHRRLT